MSQELEDKVKTYKKLVNDIAELEQRRKNLSKEILQMLATDAKTFYIAGYRVQRFSRLSIKTSLEEARALGATKSEEIINREEIKRLHKLGYPIPNVELSESIVVYNVKKENN